MDLMTFWHTGISTPTLLYFWFADAFLFEIGSTSSNQGVEYGLSGLKYQDTLRRIKLYYHPLSIRTILYMV